MDCPRCGEKSDVIDSVKNPKQKETYRKRKCPKCGHVFFTVEFEAVHNKRFMRDWFLYHRRRGNKNG